MKVLIADDSPIARRLMNKVVGAWGYDAVIAADGREALDILLADNPPRLVVTDWMMPNINGVEVCRIIAEKKLEYTIYFILLTAKGDKKDLVHALDSGAHDFIVKPPNMEELRCRLNVGRRLIEAEDKVLEYARQMQEIARKDPLTGVLNRRSFYNLAEREYSRAVRYNISTALLMMDIDYFKKINDTYGHDIGDKALILFSKAVCGNLRDVDVFARFGGEEFVVLLPDTPAAAACLVAKRLNLLVAGIDIPYEDEKSFNMTVSIGMTMLGKDADGLEQVMKRADNALYKAKDDGRNCVVRL
jgi:two-component system chemotaxis response regulator CheY